MDKAHQLYVKLSSDVKWFSCIKQHLFISMMSGM